MGIKFGDIDPLKLSEGIINILITKGIITKNEGEQIIAYSKQ